jgi:hypothetical protein
VPVQTGPAGKAAIETLTGTDGDIAIVIGLEVAGLPVTHCAVEDILTVTMSLLARVAETKVGLLVPAAVPFILHS